MKKEKEEISKDEIECLRDLIKKNGLYDVIVDLLTCVRMDANKVPIDKRIYEIQKAELLLKLERVCLTEERHIQRRGR